MAEAGGGGKETRKQMRKGDKQHKHILPLHEAAISLLQLFS